MHENKPTSEDFLYELVLALKEGRIYNIDIGPKKRFLPSMLIQDDLLSISINVRENNTIIGYKCDITGSANHIYTFGCFLIRYDTHECVWSTPVSISTDTFNRFMMLVEDFIQTPINDFDPSGKFTGAI